MLDDSIEVADIEIDAVAEDPEREQDFDEP